MTDPHASDRDVSRAIRSWLHEDRHEDASRVAGAVLDLVEATPRRRATWWPVRRTFDIMNKFVPLGLGAAAVLVALVIGTQVLGSPAPGGVGGAASASPASASPVPSVVSSPTTAPGLPEGAFLAVEASDGMPSITVTIPSSGWSFDPEFAALGKGDEVQNLPEAAILLWPYAAGTGFDVYGDPCQWKSTKPGTPATTVDDFAAALAAQPSRDASTPVDVTVGGYAGKHVTLHVPDDLVEADCDEGNFASYGVTGDAGPSRYHQGPSQIDELWILDVDGVITVLDAMYRPDTPAELIDELRAVAESAAFE
jgi:hypothetical protein